MQYMRVERGERERERFSLEAGGTWSWPSDIQSENTAIKNAASNWRYPPLLITADSLDSSIQAIDDLTLGV